MEQEWSGKDLYSEGGGMYYVKYKSYVKRLRNQSERINFIEVSKETLLAAQECSIQYFKF